MANYSLPTPRLETAIPNRQRAAFDNMIRRELKVANPSDARQVAGALMDRYRNDGRAQAIEQEARGLPFLQVAPAPAAYAVAPTATGTDLVQARSDVQMDLHQLTTDNLLKDIAPELKGWGAAIDGLIESGTAAAQFAIDPRQRDQAFAARRQLGEYARLARLIGALTPAVNQSFRGFAQSLDEVSSVILVTMGESLANLGFAGGRYLLQVPFTELQVRRDAVINALRNLSGSTQQAFSPESWSRGIDSYRQVFNLLEDQGQGDLRNVLNETELARAMDEMIHLAGDGSTEGLRALGVTAWSQLNRFHRLIQITLRQLPPSPPLVAFQDALQLFIDGFTSGGGFRLLRVARPPILFYGLYGYNDMMVADRRLLELVTRRGPFAEQCDCLLRCACDETSVLLQITLDRLLFDIDRAIDLYCVGDSDLGIPEARAASYSYLIDAMLPNLVMVAGPPVQTVWPWTPPAPPLPAPPFAAMDAPAYLSMLVPGVAADPLCTRIAMSLLALRGLLRPIPGHPFWDLWSPEQQATYGNHVMNNAPWNNGLSNVPVGLADLLHEELCLQKQGDLDWRPIVDQMAAGCLLSDRIFADQIPVSGCLPLVHDRAMALVDMINPPPRDCVVATPEVPWDLDSTMSHFVFGHP
jgi:hypothetical protein